MPTVTPVPTFSIQEIEAAVVWGVSEYGLLIAAAFIIALVLFLLAASIYAAKDTATHGRKS